MPIFYKNEVIGARRVDFFVEGKVMVELKAIENLERIHKAQAINYLEAYNIADGLLINFGALSLQFNWMYNKKLVIPRKSDNESCPSLNPKKIVFTSTHSSQEK